MSAELAPSPDVDESAGTARDCLNQFRRRGMNDSPERSFVKKALESNHALKAAGPDCEIPKRE